MIDGPPEIALHLIDLHDHLVEGPASLPEIPYRLDLTTPDLRRENRPEPVSPEPHRFMGDVDPSLVQQVLDIQQRKQVAHIHHHCDADDLGARFDTPKNAGVAHPVRLAALPVSRKPIFLGRCPL